MPLGTLFLLSHQMQCIHRLQSYNIYPSPSKHIAVNLPLLFSTTLTIKQYNESGGANWPRLQITRIIILLLFNQACFV